jgi:hypothetical protein
MPPANMLTFLTAMAVCVLTATILLLLSTFMPPETTPLSRMPPPLRNAPLMTEMPPGAIVPVLVTPPLKVAAKDGRIWPLESHWIAPGVSIGPAFRRPDRSQPELRAWHQLDQSHRLCLRPRPKGFGATLRYQFRCWSGLMIVQAMQPSKCFGALIGDQSQHGPSSGPYVRHCGDQTAALTVR